MQREPTENPQATFPSSTPATETEAQHGVLPRDDALKQSGQVGLRGGAKGNPANVAEPAMALEPAADNENTDELKIAGVLPVNEDGDPMSNSVILNPVGAIASLRIASDPAQAVASRKLCLEDLPNEVLTHVLSHLPPDSHVAVALVSKRFCALVSEPHAWRAGFTRFFRGHESCLPASTQPVDELRIIKTEPRYFTRLTPLATWRSEYLLRTRLLRSLARGKPGSSGVVGTWSRSGSATKRASAVLTYNSKLPWMISHVHAVFNAGKKLPKVIHGSADMCVATTSDPTNGKLDKWGLDEHFSFAQLDEMAPNLLYWGLDAGPAATPNVLDVSQAYGRVGGEGFPGGRVHYRAPNELRGRYLTYDSTIIDMNPEVPKIPELIDAISSLWIAKSSAVPTVTQNMIGMMAGSTLGVVTAYAVNHDAPGPRYNAGEMTARWVLSPGVPIIAIQVDDSYSVKRQSQQRVWAVALNALGEVFYLTTVPKPLTKANMNDDVVKYAWLAGRTAYWELLESTRRVARPDELDKNAVKGGYSPRSPSEAMSLSKEQIIAEAREIEKYFRYSPSHFRRVCEGWDMQRRLLCDFGGGDADSAGEGIFVIGCGFEDMVATQVTRYTRKTSGSPGAVSPVEWSPNTPASIFGGPLDTSGETAADRSTWLVDVFDVKPAGRGAVTAVGIDMSIHALTTHAEDPLDSAELPLSVSPMITMGVKQAQGPREIPGRRARLFGIGLDDGKVLVYNGRAAPSDEAIYPVRIVQTESPSVTAIALSALYMVHGGSDGLVQAWDVLASDFEPIRTLSSRSSGRVPRHILNSNPTLRDADHSSVGTIFLDPDPTILRGIVTFGTLVRCWTYSSTGQPSGRRRRARHRDVHDGLASRRQGGTVQGYIRGEIAELHADQAHRAREDERLRNRFGVGLGDLTEDQALRYAQMVSEEAFLMDELHRTSASDTTSTGFGDTASSSASLDTLTPDPSLSGMSPASATAGPSTFSPVLAQADESEDDYEQQIQRALRLSLMEGVNDEGVSPKRSNSATDLGHFVRDKPKKTNKRSPSSKSPSSSQTHTPLPTQQQSQGSCSRAAITSPVERGGEDHFEDDLDLALRLSVEEAELQKALDESAGEAATEALRNEAEFPALESKGKGKGVHRG